MTTIKAVSNGYYHDRRTWGGSVPGRNDIAEAEARATPEMRAAMAELLSLVTGQEPCTRTPNVVTGIGESLNV